MPQESLLTVVIVTGAWVALELLKYVFSRTLEAATKWKSHDGHALSPQASSTPRGNPGNSGMSAGELRTQLGEIKELLRETRDAAIGAEDYSKQTLEETRK